MNVRLLIVLCGFLGSVAQTQAQEETLKGPFVGFSVGSFRYSETDESIGAKVADDTGVYRLLGGYRFTARMSLEASWARTGEIAASATVDDPLLGPARLDTRADLETLTVRVVGVKPYDRVVLFGGFGIYEAMLDEVGQFEDPFGVTTYTYHESDRGANLIGGVQFDVRPRVSVRAEYEWFDADSMGSDNNPSVWSAGVSVLFKF